MSEDLIISELVKNSWKCKATCDCIFAHKLKQTFICISHSEKMKLNFVLGTLLLQKFQFPKPLMNLHANLKGSRRQKFSVAISSELNFAKFFKIHRQKGDFVANSLFIAFLCDNVYTKNRQMANFGKFLSPRHPQKSPILRNFAKYGNTVQDFT